MLHPTLLAQGSSAHSGEIIPTLGNHSQMILGSNKFCNILNQLWISREEEMSCCSQSAEDLDGRQLPVMGFVLLPFTDWKWMHVWHSTDGNVLNKGQLKREIFLDLRCCFPNVIKLIFSRSQGTFPALLFFFFFRQNCLQNWFIISRSASLRGKGSRSYSWRVWTFFHPLSKACPSKKGRSWPCRDPFVTLVETCLWALHTSRPSWRFQEQHWTPAEVAEVPFSIPWLLISHRPNRREWGSKELPWVTHFGCPYKMLFQRRSNQPAHEGSSESLWVPSNISHTFLWQGCGSEEEKEGNLEPFNFPSFCSQPPFNISQRQRRERVRQARTSMGLSHGIVQYQTPWN